METGNITHIKAENVWFTVPPVRTLGMYNKVKSAPEIRISEIETRTSNLPGSVLTLTPHDRHVMGIPGVLTLNALKIEKKGL